MSDGPQTPAATGSLSKTPFAHVILYLYRQRASGTLIVRVSADEYRVLFQRGRAIAAHVPQLTAALDQALLPLAASESGTFEFHEADLVGSGSEVVTGMFDPVAFVVAAVRAYARPEIVSELLSKYADGVLALEPAMDLSRLGLTPDELRFVAPLVEVGALTLESLIARAQLPREQAERLAYTLLITRTLAPETRATQNTPSSAGNTATPGVSPAPANNARSARPGSAPVVGAGAARTPPVRGLSEQLRPSGDAWRAIASRAAEIMEGRGSSPANSVAPRSPVPPDRVPQRSTQRFAEVPLSPPPEQPAQPGAYSQSRAPRPSAQSGTEARASSGAPRQAPPQRRTSSQSQSLTRPLTQPIQTQQVTRPLSQPIQPQQVTRPITQPLRPQQAVTRPISQPLKPQQATRPITQPLSGSPGQRGADSRPITPSPYGSGTPASGTPRVSPRPSLPDVETLDAAGKFKRVELLCQRNGYEDALPIIRQLLEEERKNAKYLGLLSHVLLGRTSTEDTIGKEIVDCVNQALRIDPDQPHALYTKARCYKRLGKEREALHYFRRTVAVDPTHLDAAREVRLLTTRLSDKRKR